MNKLTFLLLLSSNVVFAKLPAGLEIVPKGVSNFMESSAQKRFTKVKVLTLCLII